MSFGITLRFHLYLVYSHKLLCRICLVFVQWYEFNVLWISGLVSEWGLDSVKIVGSDCHKLSTPAQVLMELVLQFYKRLV